VNEDEDEVVVASFTRPFVAAGCGTRGCNMHMHGEGRLHYAKPGSGRARPDFPRGKFFTRYIFYTVQFARC
jgi:hypothetical protein